METKFRQEIVVPKRLSETLFRLPCVLSANKRAGSDKDIAYYTLYPFAMASEEWQFAFPGDKLCEDYNDKWHVIKKTDK